MTEHTCCDGTGYTGRPGHICAEHYESAGGTLELNRLEAL